MYTKTHKNPGECVMNQKSMFDCMKQRHVYTSVLENDATEGTLIDWSKCTNAFMRQEKWRE